MAKQRIQNLWGGTSRDWSELITPLRIFRVAAVVAAVPLSWISSAIADNPNTPNVARLAIAPGFVAALHLPVYSGNHLLDDLGRFELITLSINFAYYVLLLLTAERVWNRIKA